MTVDEVLFNSLEVNDKDSNYIYKPSETIPISSKDEVLTDDEAGLSISPATNGSNVARTRTMSTFSNSANANDAPETAECCYGSFNIESFQFDEPAHDIQRRLFSEESSPDSNKDVDRDNSVEQDQNDEDDPHEVVELRTSPTIPIQIKKRKPVQLDCLEDDDEEDDDDDGQHQHQNSNELERCDTKELDRQIHSLQEELKVSAKQVNPHLIEKGEIPKCRPLEEKRVAPSDFKVVRLLGKGDVGRVFMVIKKDTQQIYAMKMMKKHDILRRNKIHRLMTEWRVLAKTDHPFISTLYYSFQSKTKVYFITEYCAGGEFFHFLKRQPESRLDENVARFYASEVLVALEYLHLMGYVYRDIKPENILIHESGHIRLTDFDLSKQTSSKPQLCQMGDQIVLSTSNSSDESFSSFVGTVEYLAPEVVKDKGHNMLVDWWGFGVLIYEMLYGTTPFKGANQTETLSNILNKSVRFPQTPRVSQICRSLIQSLLHPDPNMRLGARNGAADVKSHRWFQGTNFDMIRTVRPPFTPVLRDPLDTSFFRKYPVTEAVEDPLSDGEPEPIPRLSKVRDGPYGHQVYNSAEFRGGSDMNAQSTNPFRCFEYFASPDRNPPYGQDILISKYKKDLKISIGTRHSNSAPPSPGSNSSFTLDSPKSSPRNSPLLTRSYLFRSDSSSRCLTPTLRSRACTSPNNFAPNYSLSSSNLSELSTPTSSGRRGSFFHNIFKKKDQERLQPNTSSPSISSSPSGKLSSNLSSPIKKSLVSGLFKRETSPPGS